MPGPGKAADADRSLPKISIRRSLIFAQVLLVGGALLVCALGTYLALYLPLLRSIAAAEMGRAADRVTADVRMIFTRVEGITRAERKWGAEGLLDLDHPDRIETLMAPLIGSGYPITSFAIAADTGAEILVLGEDNERRTIRFTNPEAWGGSARFVTRDASGRVIADERRASDYDARRRPWFQAAMAIADPDGVYWTAPFTYVSTGEPGVSAVLRWRGPDGHLYAMTNDLRLRDLTGFTQGVMLGKTGLTAILTEDGRILGLPRDPRFATPQAVAQAALKPVEALGVQPLSAAFRSWQEHGRPAAEIMSVDAGNRAWFASFHRIAPAGRTFWIATLAPQDEFGAPAKDALTIGIGLILVALVAASLAALRLGSSFSRPIEELSAASARIGEMQLDRPIVRASSVHEIDALAGSLETMRLNLVRARAELESKAEIERQLTQARKMEAVGQLAAGIAHDFNNILGGILGFAGFLVEDLPAGSPQSGFARRIIDASTRAKELVEQILSFSRVSNVERTAVDLVQLAGESEPLLRAALPTTTQLDLALPQNKLIAEVNAGQIGQILMNLCVNASDALGRRPGRIRVALAEVPPGDEDRERFRHAPGTEPGCLHFGTLDPTRSYVRLSVSDDGDGMDDATLKRVFEPFYTTKERGKGTGLGLAVVHGIVLASDGACHVTSQPGAGSSFAIYLPLAPNAAPTLASRPAAAPRGRERVLVVDDETMITDMLAVGLERLGYRVTAINDPATALRAFEHEPDRWDVVVSDYAMPGIDGVSLFHDLAKIRPEIPFVLCSGYSEDATESKAAELGIADFLIKPVPPEKLSASIRRALDIPKQAGANP